MAKSGLHDVATSLSISTLQDLITDTNKQTSGQVKLKKSTIFFLHNIISPQPPALGVAIVDYREGLLDKLFLYVTTTTVVFFTCKKSTNRTNTI